MKTVAVVGLGYVGLPLAKLFAFSGFEVLGFDNDKKKISNIKNGLSYINYISNKELKKLSKYNFTVYEDFNKIRFFCYSNQVPEALFMHFATSSPAHTA
jgi:UDP-N-acetyl-D-glucosamine dehydrogenase